MHLQTHNQTDAHVTIVNPKHPLQVPIGIGTQPTRKAMMVMGTTRTRPAA